MSGDTIQLLLGIVVGVVVVPILSLAVRGMSVFVEDEEAVLVTSFGKLVATFDKPGLHVLVTKLAPWTKVIKVSLRRDFRHFKDVHVNDSRGTTVIVDLWVEFRVTDPAKAIFSVTEWDGALQNLVSHAATSILGGREFREILCDRTELGELLAKDIAPETDAWGIEIELVFIRNVSLLPEVSRQMFETIAARLERAKADLEERGRLDVAQLEADTSKRVAALVAEAKGQYPAAIGRALAEIKKRPAIFRAYTELYDLSLIRPHRTVAFVGFGDEMRATDAAMIQGDGERATVAGRDGVLKRA